MADAKKLNPGEVWSDRKLNLGEVWSVRSGPSACGAGFCSGPHDKKLNLGQV